MRLRRPGATSALGRDLAPPPTRRPHLPVGRARSGQDAPGQGIRGRPRRHRDDHVAELHPDGRVRGRLPLFHIDLYRLADGADALAGGLIDDRQAAGVTLVEWPERLGDALPRERLDVVIDGLGDDPRTIMNTHFINPNGLFDKNHYTTAMDLALITNYAIKNPIFADIFGTKVLKWEGQSWKTNILTHHRMLKGELAYPGITGGKTGYTSEAKQTLATTARNAKLGLTAVVLNSEQQREKYDDTARLFDYGFKNFQHSILKQDEIYKKNNKEFCPEMDTLITESINGTIKEVNTEGKLSIKNTNGQVSS